MTGICIAVASTFCGAAMLSFSGKVTSTRTVSNLIACIAQPIHCIPLDPSCADDWRLHCRGIHLQQSRHAELPWQSKLSTSSASFPECTTREPSKALITAAQQP